MTPGSVPPTQAGSGPPTEAGSGPPTEAGSVPPTEAGSGPPTQTGSLQPTQTGSAPETQTAPGPTGHADPQSQEPAVSLDHAQARIANRLIWDDVTVEVGAGEFAAILGPNGSGKTTLLRVLLGELPLSHGSATILGERPGAANRRIGYLPQRRSFDAGMRIRGIDLVRLGLEGSRWGLPLPPLRPRRRHPDQGHPDQGHPDARPDWRDRVNEVITRVGAAEYANRPIGQLSGGEQQRLLIAQALVSRPELLILDEPLDSLDLPNQTATAALLARISREQGVTLLLVAHDVNPLLPYLNRVIYFGAQRAVVGRPREVISATTLSRLYGVPIEVLEASDGRMVVVGLPEPPAHHSDRHAHHSDHHSHA